MLKNCNYWLKASLILSVFLAVAFLAAFASDYDLSLIKRFYSIGTASINGTYYPVGNSIARVLTREMKDVVVIAEPTAGSVANISYLKNGHIDLSLVQSDVAWQAFKGIGMFSRNRYPELRVLSSLYSEVIQIVVKKSSGIRTIADLKGCKISVGSKESGSAVNAIQVLDAAGLTEGSYELVYERFTRATESLRDGYVDAVYYTGGIPADGISRLAAKIDLMLVEVPAEVQKRLVDKYPYFSSEVIPPATYKGQLGSVSTIGLRALIASSEQLDKKQAKEILTIIYKNSALIASQNTTGIYFNVSHALKGVSAEMLHPAALEFFAAKGIMAKPAQ